MSLWKVANHCEGESTFYERDGNAMLERERGGADEGFHVHDHQCTKSNETEKAGSRRVVFFACDCKSGG